MALKQITKRTAQKKYGIRVFDNDRFYLRDDGCVVDSAGLVRYYPPLSQRMSAESYALLGRVYDYCLSFRIHSLHDFRGGECEPACPFYPSNNEDGHLPMCTTAFIRDNPEKVREILDAEKKYANKTESEAHHD